MVDQRVFTYRVSSSSSAEAAKTAPSSSASERLSIYMLMLRGTRELLAKHLSKTVNTKSGLTVGIGKLIAER
jgi:hypothetical protein